MAQAVIGLLMVLGGGFALAVLWSTVQRDGRRIWTILVTPIDRIDAPQSGGAPWPRRRRVERMGLWTHGKSKATHRAAGAAS